MSGRKLLVLFDAENMPIQTYYREVKAVVGKHFSPAVWRKAQLVTAYKEKVEGYSNRGYNSSIKHYYVEDGKDKADDKLVEVAHENSEMDMVIVSSDKALIKRIQELANGRVLVCNTQTMYAHLLEEVQTIRELKREVEKQRRYYLEQYKKADRIVEHINTKIAKKRKILKGISPQKSDVKDALLDGLQEKMEPSRVKSHRELREVSLEIVAFFKEKPEINTKLKGEGLDVSVVKKAIEYAVIDFSKSYFGFDRFIDFVRFFVKDTSLKLLFKAPSHYLILLNGYDRDAFVDVESFDDNEIIETLESMKGVLLENNSPSSLDLDVLERLKRKLG
jgi:uncharacterized protein YaiI (UPF0178 family)